jgi:tyrosyl-tRNA synthetase
MSGFKSDFMRIVHERGMVHQCSDTARLDELLSSGVRTAYIGFDCTADSLHVGHLLQIMLLRWWQKSGHKPIALMGGGTTKVGDPSGRDETRQLLTTAQIDANMASIKKSFANYLTFGDGATDAVMANNADWLDGLGYIDFLRDYGRHFTINTMIKQETVARRLRNEEPYTYLEINYMLLQSYDFLELWRTRAWRLQMVGADQWGNIVNGVELCRRVADAHSFGLTTPLITTASGAKMGKTVSGAVWLNADMRSPYEYWQFWRNTEDADVGRFLRLFTDVPVEEIARLEAATGSEINAVKARLADEATTLLHGAAAAAEARAAAEAVFSGGSTGEGMPTFEVSRDKLKDGLLISEALVSAGLCTSKSEARRAIKAASVRLNAETVTDEGALVRESDLDADGLARLSMGRKRHARLKAVQEA